MKNGLNNTYPENYLEDEAEEMVRKFREQKGSEEITAVQEQLWQDGEQMESEPWSDRRAGHSSKTLNKG